MIIELPRNRKRLIIPYNRVLEAIAVGVQLYTSNMQVTLPEGCKVVQVYQDPARDAFVFVLEHPSFTETPIGCEHERLEVNWS